MLYTQYCGTTQFLETLQCRGAPRTQGPKRAPLKYFSSQDIRLFCIFLYFWGAQHKSFGPFDIFKSTKSDQQRSVRGWVRVLFFSAWGSTLLTFGPAFSGPEFSTPAIWSSICRSCIFWSCIFSAPDIKYLNNLIILTPHILHVTMAVFRGCFGSIVAKV